MEIALHFSDHSVVDPNNNVYSKYREGIFVSKDPTTLLAFLIVDFENNKDFIIEMISSYRVQKTKSLNLSKWFSEKYLGKNLLFINKIILVINQKYQKNFYEIFSELLI